MGGLPEGASLVRAANGAVYRVSATPALPTASPVPAPTTSSTGLGAFHEESLQTVAAVNRWRCDGFPLYGQDLVRSLTLTRHSRHRGQGWLHCLQAAGTTHLPSPALAKLTQLTPGPGPALASKLLAAQSNPSTGDAKLQVEINLSYYCNEVAFNLVYS